MANTFSSTHDHIFLGEGHEKNERRTWMVIALCSFMMVAEIVGGLLFGSIALVADGLHMSTHASALLLAALAYSYARRHADDARFTFGTGKLGDLAGFSSAIVLAMIALLIGYEALTRFIWPVSISFNEAIPIAVLGLIVNVASVLLLSGGGHHHDHGHSHAGHGHDHDEAHILQTGAGPLTLEIFEDGVPPRFRLSCAGRDPLRGSSDHRDHAPRRCATGVRDGRTRRLLESIDEIPEPHSFTARVTLDRGGGNLLLGRFRGARACSRRGTSRQQYARRHYSRFGGRGGFGAGHRWPVVRTLSRLDMDGPSRGLMRSRRHRRLVLRTRARHKRCLARHEPRPGHGGANASDNRDRWRSIDRSAPVASRPRSLGSDPVGRYTAAARTGVLSITARPI